MSSLPADKLNRPEIEASLMSAGYLLRLESLRSIKSSVDILEVPQDPNLGFSCLEGLDHNGLISHFEVKVSPSKFEKLN